MNALFHFLRHAPATLALKRRHSQRDLYEIVMDRADAAGLNAERDAITSGLSGRVLEVGCGTGHMFAHYPEGLDVTALELDASFAELARARAAKSRAHIVVEEGNAESLPFADARFDVVIFALVLCSVSHPARALAEAKRVLRPDGRVRLVEHVRSRQPVAGLAMDLANPIWLALNGQGCRMNRDTERTLAEAGFVIDEVVPFQVFSAGLPAFPMKRMAAHI